MPYGNQMKIRIVLETENQFVHVYTMQPIVWHEAVNMALVAVFGQLVVILPAVVIVVVNVRLLPVFGLSVAVMFSLVVGTCCCWWCFVLLWL
jgi:hypothetical protein